tara:strand:+ start:2569 stop:2844 length:276 start_codon:yes stop_codon:yes gene_type:complete
MEWSEWIRLIGGGFAHQTAPFAVHAFDEKRAIKYLDAAQNAGLRLADALDRASAYLDQAPGWPTDKSTQLEHVRTFYAGRLPGQRPVPIDA